MRRVVGGAGVSPAVFGVSPNTFSIKLWLRYFLNRSTFVPLQQARNRPLYKRAHQMGPTEFLLVPRYSDVASCPSMETNELRKATDPQRSLPAHALWRRYCYVLLLAAWMG